MSRGFVTFELCLSRGVVSGLCESSVVLTGKVYCRNTCVGSALDFQVSTAVDMLFCSLSFKLCHEAAVQRVEAWERVPLSWIACIICKFLFTYLYVYYHSLIIQEYCVLRFQSLFSCQTVFLNLFWLGCKFWILKTCWCKGRNLRVSHDHATRAIRTIRAIRVRTALLS